MKTLYIKLLTFLLFFFAISFVFQYSYKVLVYNRTDNGRKEKQFSQYQGELKYLFLGDSHSQNAIDPSIIGASFNFSSANENFIQTYYKLKRIIKSLDKNVEYIVLPIDPSSFSSFRTGRFIYASTLITFSDYLEIAIHERDPSYLRTWLDHNVFMYAGKYTIINRLRKVNRERNFSKMKFGFKGRDGMLSDYIDVKAECERKVQLYLGGQEYFDPALRDYFIRILEFCQDRGIGVYLMKMPVAKEYVDACNNLFSIEDYYNEIYKIADEQKSVVKFLDFQDYFFDNQQYLRNPDHVNLEGAMVFSRMLAGKFDDMETSLSKQIEK
ncbi:MAG: hypothetical protein U9R19_07185 [Bacteroidota bacterium]|nr:hypothetical protein [Bacteroidota bacterium]